MNVENNITVRIQAIKQLESISGGLSALAELAMRQGDFVLAQRFRDGITLADAKIEYFKNTACGNGSDSSRQLPEAEI